MTNLIKDIPRHVEDPMDWDTDSPLRLLDRYSEPEPGIVIARSVHVSDLYPEDLEFLLNFVSGWKENGITNLFYFTYSEHDNAFELIVEVEDNTRDELFVSEVTFYSRDEGSRTGCTSYHGGDTVEETIDSVIDDVLDL